MKVKDVALTARQIKAGPDDGLGDGEFTAYASVFGNKDSYGDVVVKGAFTNTLTAWKDSGQNIPLLFGHNMADPDFNIGHVVAAEEDDHGLKVTAQLDLENPKAAQVYRMMKGRRINQMSYAYDVVDGSASKSDDGEDGDAFELRDLKLYEVSVVTIGANQETEILGVKSLAEAIAVGVARGAKAGRTLSAKNETSLRDARDAIDSVLKSLGDSGDGDAAKSGSNDQEKASDTDQAKSGATEEDSTGDVSAASDEGAKSEKSSVARLAAQIDIYAATTPQEGVSS